MAVSLYKGRATDPSGFSRSDTPVRIGDRGWHIMSQPPIGLDSLHRFVTDVPQLQRLLESPPTSECELALRAEMRATLGKLSETLFDAAEEEAIGSRAAVLRAASLVAARLAACRVRQHRGH
jgi:hypothetical protein